MQTVRKARRAQLTMAIAVLAVAACHSAADDSAVENDSRNSTLPLPPLPVAEPPMNRQSLLLAVAKAASAAALGTDDAAEQRTLDGKRFEVRIRFGCAPAEEAASADRFSVRFDQEDRTLRLRASPDLGIDDAPIAALVAPKSGDSSSRDAPPAQKTKEEKKPTKATEAKTIEAVEGFWLRRPWLLDEGCPVAATGGPEPETTKQSAEGKDEGAKVAPEKNSTTVGQTAQRETDESQLAQVGIAQFFTKADARTGRRDSRAYETTKVLGDDQKPSAQGYNLVLSGRLRAQPLGQVISCTLPSADKSPQCVVSAEFDRVWIETPGSRDIVAEWGS